MSEKVEAHIARAFDRIEELELKLSKFQPLSDVARLNQAPLDRELPVSQEFLRLMPFAQTLWRKSQGAFNPFSDFPVGKTDPIVVIKYDNQPYAKKTSEVTLDLSGVAKGFVVDEIVDYFSNLLEFKSGVINAGGDLRFFHVEERHAEIRLESSSSGLRFQSVLIAEDALATSSFQEFKHNPESQTRYTRKPMDPLSENSSVSVIAKTCAVADGLTKVGWFAERSLAEACATHFGAQFLFLTDVRDSLK